VSWRSVVVCLVLPSAHSLAGSQRKAHVLQLHPIRDPQFAELFTKLSMISVLTIPLSTLALQYLDLKVFVYMCVTACTAQGHGPGAASPDALLWHCGAAD
jgi:hypothetical protein